MVQCFATSLGLQAVKSITSQLEDHSFESRRVADQATKGLNSVLILVAWSFWNYSVFDGLQPTIKDALHTWEWGVWVWVCVWGGGAGGRGC